MAATTTAAPTAAGATVLIVDDSPLCREMVCKSLHAEGVKTVQATDGMDGLARLGSAPIDGIILDNEMPRMTGLAFLKALRSDARWKHLPVLMLTTTASKTVIMEATKFGLNGYLLKTKLAMPELVARVRGVLTAATAAKAAKAAAAKPAPKPLIPKLVTRDATLQAVSNFAEMRTLCGAAAQAGGFVSSSGAAAAPGQLAAIVRLDPVLALRSVQLATSSSQAGAKSWAGSVEGAVRTAGIDAVKNLASSLDTLSVFPSDRANGAPLLRCWLHALTVAGIMNRVVPRTDEIPAGLPYLVGLTHDMVEIVLRQRFPAEFSVAADFAKQNAVQFTELVQNVFGVPYGELVEALFQRLRIPELLSASIAEYAFSANAAADAHATILPRALAIANFLAHGVLATSTSQSLVAPLLQSDCLAALIPTAAIDLDAIYEEAVTTTRSMAALGNDPLLTNPLLVRREVKLWYARPSTFAALDPLETALGRLAQVESHGRMPASDELAKVHALVVVSTGDEATENFHVKAATANRPTLVVTRTAEMTANYPDHVEQVQYPVTLDRLLSFVSKVTAKA